MILLLPIFVFLPVLASPALAKPANRQAMDRQAMEKAARKACLTGDYRKGVDILADLFVDTKNNTYIFNQGRCFQQSHQWVDALDRFTEYQRKATNLPADEQAEVEKYIADCKAQIQQSQPPVPAQPTPPAAVASTAPVLPPEGPTATSASAPPASGPSATLTTPAAETSRPGAGLRTAGIVAGAVGVAGIITGVVLALKTQSNVDNMYSNGYSPSAESSRKSYETWGWVGYGVGAAGIVAGTTMYLLGWSAGRSGATETHLSLLPAIGHDGAMLLLQGGIR
jgi:hypothetical protein